MRFPILIEQNVPRLYVTVQNAVLVCVVYRTRDFRDKFYRAAGSALARVWPLRQAGRLR